MGKMETKTATQAATALPEMVRNADAGIHTTITRQAVPVAVLVPMGDYQAMIEAEASECGRVYLTDVEREGIIRGMVTEMDRSIVALGASS